MDIKEIVETWLKAYFLEMPVEDFRKRREELLRQAEQVKKNGET